MKNHCFFVKILLLLSFVSCGNKKTPHEILSKKTQILNIVVLAGDSAITYRDDLVFYKNQLFSGYIEEFSADKKMLSKIPYFRGKLEGNLEKWYKNGQIAEQRYYEMNRKKGKHSSWWENGKLRFEYFFDKDLAIGTHKQWYKTGELCSIANYDSTGHPAGTQQMWYEGGKVKYNLVIVNGRRFGFLGAKGCSNPNKKNQANS